MDLHKKNTKLYTDDHYQQTSVIVMQLYVDGAKDGQTDLQTDIH